VASIAVKQDLIRVIAEEMAFGVETAVDCWMTQIDSALSDTRLTTLGRLNAVHEIVQNYKLLTGKVQFD
jgi:predicted site-specific integrase-resolvase